MPESQKFPESLLLQSPLIRLAFFDNYTMAHPRLEEAFNLLKLLVSNSGESRVIFIYGPTGVGKTTLRLLIEKWLIETNQPELEVEKGWLPFASVEAVVQKSGLFNSKDHIKRCLFALHEPLIDHKIDYGTRGIYRNSNGQIVIESKVIETDLGWALEQALKHRKPKIFFIDEAHHMLMVASGRKLTDLPEAIKSLANRTRVVHGLVGTYELLTLHDVGDQLSRRSAYVHFPRYRADCTQDREIFQSVVWGFQLNMPLKEEPDLVSHWDYCYERSLGCVGILKNWLRNALIVSNTISTYIFEVLKSNIPAFSRLAGMNKATIGLWCKGKVIPQIGNLLLLTSYLEMSLLDFLTTDVLLADSRNTCPQPNINVVKQIRKAPKHLNFERKQVLNVVLIEVLKEYPAPSLENVALRLRYRPLVLQYHFPSLCEEIKVRYAEYRKESKQQKIQPILEAALKEFPPPSLLEINRRLGYKNNSYLYRYFSEPSRKISKRYKDYQKASGQEKRERICQEIIDTAQLLHKTGQKPTQARVTKLLAKPSVMLSWYAKKTLRDIQCSLGYE